MQSKDRAQPHRVATGKENSPVEADGDYLQAGARGGRRGGRGVGGFRPCEQASRRGVRLPRRHRHLSISVSLSQDLNLLVLCSATDSGTLNGELVVVGF